MGNKKKGKQNWKEEESAGGVIQQLGSAFTLGCCPAPPMTLPSFYSMTFPFLHPTVTYIKVLLWDGRCDLANGGSNTGETRARRPLYKKVCFVIQTKGMFFR